MTPIAVAFLALSMSADAFAVCIGRGASLSRPRFSEAVRTGAIFGITEGCMPLIGWAIGAAASSFVAAYDHWIAFAILAGVGLHMAVTALRQPTDPILTKPVVKTCATGSGLKRFFCLILTAVGTSIDSMAVGASLAFFKVNIGVIALAIGTATFLMSSFGMLVGRHLGQKCGRPATVIAGLVLIAIGALILWEHVG